MIGPPDHLEAIVTMTAERWRIELLGEVRARYGDGAWLPLSYQKPVALLLYLAAYPQRSHPREALIDRFWPEADPEAGRLSLRTALHALRRFLESAGDVTAALLLAERTTLRFDPAAFTSDLGEFLAAVSQAEHARTPVEQSQALGRAAAGYSGEFLPGCNDAWAFAERERLATTQREVLQRLVRVREELGDGEEALSAAQEMVRLDPLWEEAHYDVMRLYAALGQPQAVLRQYQELERVLSEELGETPSAEARALAEELRQGARTLVVARRSPLAADPEAGCRLPPRANERRTSAAFGTPSPEPLAAGSLVGNLPVQLTRFYGRQEEIARLTELLTSPVSRLVTVTGPGGSGKTRLAVAAVGRLVEAPAGPSPSPKSVVFVPLADVTDSVRIPDAIADALGIERSPEIEVLEQVIGQLAARPWLLVLDNYEHLVEEGALWVRTLLTRAPSLTCLVTSRQRLGITGEQEFALLPLPTPRRGTALEQLEEYPSVQLFVDRARSVRREFALTAGNGASVAELCDRLDGLPLALELAAARIAVLTPKEMLGQLEGRFAFLVSRQRDTPARHRTLRAVIEGSYQLLSPDLQRFFARLSVFRGGWTLEAAEAVYDGEGGKSSLSRALDYMEQLRECSLLMVEEEGRYRLLETLREYAWEQLAASGEKAEIRRRHRDWFLQLAEHSDASAADPERVAWLTPLSSEPVNRPPAPVGSYSESLDRLERELDNFRAALACCQERADADSAAAEAGLRLAVALASIWFRRGYLAEGQQWVEEALARAPGAPPAARAVAIHQASKLAHARGRREQSRSLLQSARGEQEKAVSLARATGDRRQIAHACLALAELTQEVGDVDSAWSHAVDARQQMQELEDPVGVARSLYLLTSLALDRGDRRAAGLLLEERLATSRKLGDAGLLIQALGAMGHFARDEGDHARARSLYEESLIMRREVGDKVALAQSLEDFAVLAGRERQAERAVRLLGASEASCETLGARPPMAIAVEYERTVAMGRAGLGEAAFAALWAEGRALSLEQAVAFALERSES